MNDQTRKRRWRVVRRFWNRILSAPRWPRHLNKGQAYEKQRFEEQRKELDPEAYRWRHHFRY